MVSSRDPSGAFEVYARSVQTALHCVTPARLRRTLIGRGSQGLLAFDRNQAIRLVRREDRRQIFFEFRQLIRVVGPEDAPDQAHRILIEDYEYKVIDSRRRELFAFHWHPASASEATWPHVHVGSVAVDTAAEGMESGFYERFSRLHIPTGMLAIEQVVRFLITELLVTPLRADWDAVLQEGEMAFQRERPWQG